MSGFLQVTLHPTRKAVQDERTADNGNPEHTGRKIFAFHFEHDTFIQTEMGDLLMNDIQISENKEELTLTTIDIADMMEMPHWQILRKLDGTKKIKGIIQILGDNKIVVTDYFIPSTYLSEQNKEMPCYKVTRMGCEFLANKFNGEKGIVFTARYVKRFHDMEQALKNPQAEIPEKDPFEHWEIRWKHETETWFSKNNWKLSIILERFGWTRKFLYHKILVELSDLHNLRAIEKAYYASYGYPPEYALDLLDFNRDLNDTATRYINYLLIEE